MSIPDYLNPSDVSGLVIPSDRYQVVAVAQESELYGNELVDALDISYTVTGRAGVFSVQVPLVGRFAFEYGIDLSGEAQIVEDIYSLPV